MISYSPQVSEFISGVSQIVPNYPRLTEGDIISGLRILASMMEARITGGRIYVQIVNIENDEECDSSDAWKYGG